MGGGGGGGGGMMGGGGWGQSGESRNYIVQLRYEGGSICNDLSSDKFTRSKVMGRSSILIKPPYYTLH